MKFLCAILSMFMFLGTSIGIIPYDKNVEYGGTKYVEPVVTETLTLAKDGESKFLIVISSGAEPAEITAAQEISKYVFKMSGVTLPIARDNEKRSSTHEIIIGRTLREFGDTLIDRSALSQDGFILRVIGTKLYIAGGSARGTLYGAYTFLEEQLGCRWYTPKDIYAPQKTTVEFNAKLNDLQNPSFELRRNASSGTSASFYAQNKINVTYWSNNIDYGGAMTFVLWDVTLTKLVPDSLFAEHPEYFAFRKEENARSTMHVCLSNPDIFDIALENAENAIDNNTTDAKHIHIGQKDNIDYCQCDECEKLTDYYGSISAPTVLFANKLQQALADDGYEDFYVTFYAYNETRNPPTENGLKCNDRVIPVVCGSHQACHCHPYYECGHTDGNDTTFIGRFADPDTMEFKDSLEAWTKVAKYTYIYEYTINFLNTWQFFANFATLQPNAKWMHDIGVTGITYTCGDAQNAVLNELRNYLLCKIQWNVNCDVEYHMMDFLNYYYGEEAAKYVREYIDLYTAKVAASTHAFDFDWHYQAGIISPAEAIKFNRLFKDAFACSMTDEQRFNLEKVQLSWRYYKANLFYDEFCIFSPLRGKENEKLFDDFVAHGITKTTSVGGPFPPKENINFFLSRPIDWRI